MGTDKHQGLEVRLGYLSFDFVAVITVKAIERRQVLIAGLGVVDGLDAMLKDGEQLALGVLDEVFADGSYGIPVEEYDLMGLHVGHRDVHDA